MEERLAFVEGRVQELSGGYGQLREDIHGLQVRVGSMDERLSARIEALDQRLSSRMDALGQKVDRYREELGARIDGLDHRLSNRADALDQKVDRYREELGARIEALDQRLSSRVDALDQKVDRYREELAARADSVEARLGSRIDAVEQKVDRYRDELAVRMDASEASWARGCGGWWGSSRPRWWRRWASWARHSCGRPGTVTGSREGSVGLVREELIFGPAGPQSVRFNGLRGAGRWPPRSRRQTPGAVY